MLEQSVWFGAEALEIATETFKKRLAKDRAGAMMAVEDNFEFLGTNGVGVDRGQNRFEMSRCRVFEIRSRPDLFPRDRL